MGINLTFLLMVPVKRGNVKRREAGKENRRRTSINTRNYEVQRTGLMCDDEAERGFNGFLRLLCVENNSQN